ncbi:phage tail tape measure protein [Malaciobacter canalis]|uniref:Phage tail tape measure protein n=1 Tax=Malaciobacter canalis TaxID=1912871 RepID=A0ABX4LTX7_9BACT|nr:phage tail tape measure protein [Malaciobacter canalis]PHO09788.1 phage tail tape measure protein [Malaciobacter canalis]QEE33406.1 phage tail tape measure protein [Malaciobacter canalis]
MKTIGLGIVIQGAISSSFSSSIKKTNFGLVGIDKSIKRMNKTKFEMKEFQKLSKDTTKNKDKLNGLSRSLKRAGIDTRNLNQDSKLLRLSLVNLKKASKIDIKIKGAKEQFNQEKAHILGIGAAIYGLKKTSDVASDVLKAQGEIRSLDISKRGIDDITKAGHRMSLQFGQITAPQFIRASYDIKSGIASLSEKGVRDFTKMAATTAVATKAQIADMTKLYALGYGIFRKDYSSDMNFGKSFSGAIAASVQAFRTDGADLAAGISNVGASAKAMGVSLEEELAIIGLSKSAFDSASEAGSGYRGFLSGVGKAQKKLGLEFTDSHGKMLPMVEILGKIKDKYSDLDLAENDELKEAFGSEEAIKTISALLPKMNELERAQKNISKAMEGGLVKSEKMALAMDSGYGWEKMSNAVSYASFTFGKVLTPVVNFAATALGGFAKSIAWVDERVSWFIPLVSGVTFGIIGLYTVIKVATLTKLGFALATNTVRKAMFLGMAQNYMSATSLNALNLRMKAYSLWTTAVTAKQWLFNVALNANPIGLIITGVAALIGLGVILYKKFEPVRNLFNGLYEGGKKLLSFIGFGGDDEESNTLKKNDNAKKLAATAITTTALATNPIKTGEVKPQAAVTQHNAYTLKVDASNASNNVDVTRAVEEAIENAERRKRNRSFED